MNYYTVARIGSGTDTDPYRPNVPTGISWVGNVGSDGGYLIATPSDLGADTTTQVKQLPITALQNACQAKGIPFTYVYNIWYVG